MRQSSIDHTKPYSASGPLLRALIRTLALTALCLQITTSAARANQTVYSFGIVPQFEARQLHAIWGPVLAELETRTGLKFRMSGAPNIADFEKAFIRGDFDFAFMNPYHSMLAFDSQGYVPLVRDDARELYGVLVVLKNGPVQSLADLDGERIAFPAPNALGASLLLRSELQRDHGITFEPVYTSTHSSVYLNVVLGEAMAGGGVMSTLRHQGDEIQSRLRVLHETRHVPPHPVVAHPRVPKEDRERVRAALLDMAQSEQGRSLLANIPIKNPVSADVRDYQVFKAWGLEDYYIER